MRYLTIGLLFVAVAGCSHVPLPSAVRLGRLDPLTADPQYIQIAVRMPDGLSVPDSGAVMEIGTRRADIDAEEKLRLVFEKQVAASSHLADGLEPKAGTHVEIFRVSERDIPRLRALQETAKSWKADAPDDTKGSLSIQASGCRTSTLPRGPLHISTYLRTDPGSSFFVVARDMDLRSLVSNNGGEAFSVPLCDVPER